MKTNKILMFCMIFLIGILLISLASAAYSRSSPQYVRPGSSLTYKYGTGVDLNPMQKFNEDMCEAGQDFILQIPLGGCAPAVVRSDLLEEQNVPVFCQIAATKINPLIDVNAIDYISFKGDYPDGVSGVGFHPARAAIKSTRGQLLSSPILENIGYAVIVLKQTKNESSMPDYVEGELTAHLRYDIENAFGIGKATYYVPEMTDVEWNSKYKQYGFWNGRGYLRAESVDEMGATISVYRDQTQKVGTVYLDEGETSRQIQLPDFYCLAGLKLRLDDMAKADTRARINVDGNVYEVGRNERFLDNQCQIRGEPEKHGLSEKVSVYCRTDERGKTFDLSISPKVVLEVEDENKKMIEKEHSVGQILYRDGDRNVFLGYIGENKNGNVFIIPVISPETSAESFANSLDFELVKNYALVADKVVDLTDGGAIKNILLGAGMSWAQIGMAIHKGTDFGGPIYKGSVLKTKFFVGGSFLGKIGAMKPYSQRKIKFKELVSPTDKQFASKEFKDNFENAIADYRAVADNFPSIPSTKNVDDESLAYKTYGEEALFRAITLSWETGQRATMRDLCDDFEQLYPKSSLYEQTKCDETKSLITNSETASHLVTINGEVKSIWFEGITEPSFEEFGAEVSVRGTAKGEYDGILKVRKGQRIYLSEQEFFELEDVETDYISINTQLIPQGVIGVYGWQKTNYKVGLNKYVVLSGTGNYEIKVNKINLKRQAKVSVIPRIENAGTETNFSFKIGIEKRAIQLSPEKTKDLIKKLDKQIKQWGEFSDNLGNVIKGFKGACLGVGAMLTVKNFFGNLNGKSIARQEIMQGDKGWMKICKDAVESGELFDEKVNYVGVDDCLFQNNEKIENAVKANQEIMKLQGSDERKVTEDNIKNNNVLEALASRIETTLNSEGKSLNKNVKYALTKQGYEDGVVSLSQARDLDRLNELANSDEVSSNIKEMAIAKRDGIIKTIAEVAKDYKTIRDVQERDKSLGLEGIMTNVYHDEWRQIGEYNGFTMPAGEGVKQLGNIPKGAQVSKVVYNNSVYYVTLKSEGIIESLRIVNVFDSSGKNITGTPIAGELKGRYSSFKKYDFNSYHNPIDQLDKKVQFFETAPYAGLPALVPFDTSHGWYVRVKQTIGVFGGIRAYDDSGQIGSFYLCNVMEDKRIASDVYSGDEECMKFNPATGQVYGTFPGLTEAQTNKQINCAIDAVESASRVRAKNKNINGKMISINTRSCGTEKLMVGNAAVNIPEFQCQNFMSPKDCWILFNACDPVICPSSRCNFGGSYYVKDVVQSGIIGSIALCLPNIKEKIIVPVCLTGVKAGLDGLISIANQYKKCLQHSLETGEQIGICDEIHSIYLCEFLWRQSLPLFKLGIPKLLEFATGQGQRGGGEYLAVKSAWENAENSITYFTQYYGANAFTAFKARSTDEVGTEICKASISARYPVSGVFFDNLLEPDSPVQFHGWFSENTFTTATVPPTSVYKVYYHIFAGKDMGASYQVYLSGSEQGGFYHDVGNLIVDSGYIAKGESADGTKDFTAPAGYKKLCISVNNQVECDFGRVSTSFAINYAQDIYEAEQAKEQVTTTKECEGGTASAFSLLNPNIQEGVDDAVNSKLYNKGIIRVCATSNPGTGTDVYAGSNKSRWADVGYCGNENVRCWLDLKSVEDVIHDLNLEQDAIGDVMKNYMDKLGQDKEVYSEDEFENEIKTKLESFKNNPSQIILYITDELITKVLMNNNKAELFLTRAKAFATLALAEYKKGLKEVEYDEDITDYTLDVSKGIRGISFANCISPEKIDQILKNANSPAAGTGKTFFDLGRKYNIDPIVALGFFKHESSFGTAGIATRTKSIGNIVWHGGCLGKKVYIRDRDWCAHNTWEEGIETWYRLIAGPGYVGQGKDSIEEIIPKYAPSTENDVQAYIKSVNDFVKENSDCDLSTRIKLKEKGFSETEAMNAISAENCGKCGRDAKFRFGFDDVCEKEDCEEISKALQSKGKPGCEFHLFSGPIPSHLPGLNPCQPKPQRLCVSGYSLFTFEDGEIGQDYNYCYNGEKWEWSNDRQNWYEVSSEPFYYVTEQTTSSGTGVGSGDVAPSYEKVKEPVDEGRSKELIKSLQNLNYEQGVRQLVGRTVIEEGLGGLIGRDPELNTEIVKLNSEGEFKVSLIEREASYKLDENHKWNIKLPEKITGGYDVSSFTPINNEIIERLDSPLKELSEKLRQISDLSQGAVILFDFNKEVIAALEDTTKGKITLMEEALEEVNVLINKYPDGKVSYNAYDDEFKDYEELVDEICSQNLIEGGYCVELRKNEKTNPLLFLKNYFEKKV